MSEENLPMPDYESPPWSRSTKVIVTVVGLLLVALVTYRFQALIAQLVLASIVAYLLNPIVDFVDNRTSLRRGAVIVLAYLIVGSALITAMVLLGVAAFQEITSLINQVPRLIDDTTDILQEITGRTDPIEIGNISIDPITIPWDAITQQVIGFVEPALTQGTRMAQRVATVTVGLIGNFFFIFFISLYIAIEIPRLAGYVGDFAQLPGYRRDAERLMRDFGRIWSAYLRGQVILGLIIGFVVWVGLSLLGVQNSLALGILSGLLEFIPIIGPVVGAGVAIVVALFQPENYLGLASWQLALLVLGLMFAIQQLESSLLVPRIVGNVLDLHPVLVMVAVFMGGSLAGILGAILAAPVLATLKLLSIYAWRKMFDQHPFPTPEVEKPPPRSLRERIIARKNQVKALWQRYGARRGAQKREKPDSS